MAPSAYSTELDANGSTDRFHDSGKHNAFITHVHKNSPSSSLLLPTPADETLDLLCVGFGPASLSIAVALHDSLEQFQDPKELEHLQGKLPKVAFLERQCQFAWHAGMLLPGAKMQITFLKDLATLRNPRSKFTFVNYLHENNRLVQFTNLSTFLPQRVEYDDYLRWCANQFTDIVTYNQEVFNVCPASSQEGEPVNGFLVTAKSKNTGQTTTRRARNVVIAVGGQPNMPPPFPTDNPRVIHSSQFKESVPRILPDLNAPYTVAVVGSGQSAAEIFKYVQEFYPNTSSRLLIKGSALRPSDDSPFVNEIFDPSRVNDIYRQSPNQRAHSMAADRATNYGVVRLELLEHIYETLYTQRLRHDSEESWPHRILPYRQVTQVSDKIFNANLDEQSPRYQSKPGDKRIRLTIRNESNHFTAHKGLEEETLDVDAVFVASGYRREAHENLLRDARHLMPKQDREVNGRWRVGRDYGVIFEEGKVAPGSGVWLQGCCEDSHGLSDTLLSILATRAGELVQSMFSAGGDSVTESESP